jgi:hypothetical protein
LRPFGSGLFLRFHNVFERFGCPEGRDLGGRYVDLLLRLRIDASTGLPIRDNKCSQTVDPNATVGLQGFLNSLDQ